MGLGSFRRVHGANILHECLHRDALKVWKLEWKTRMNLL